MWSRVWQHGKLLGRKCFGWILCECSNKIVDLVTRRISWILKIYEWPVSWSVWGLKSGLCHVRGIRTAEIADKSLPKFRPLSFYCFTNLKDKTDPYESDFFFPHENRSICFWGRVLCCHSNNTVNLHSRMKKSETVNVRNWKRQFSTRNCHKKWKSKFDKGTVTCLSV